MKKVKLSTKYQKYLQNEPENGMGYQLVDVYMSDGHVFKSQIVINSKILLWRDHQDYEISNIKTIMISK
jgi:hypothetical protein